MEDDFITLMEENFITLFVMVILLLVVFLGGIALGRYSQRVDINENKPVFFDCIERHEIDWCFDNFVVEPKE